VFAIAFDLRHAVAEDAHPNGASGAYSAIARILRQYGFERVQGSVYRSQSEDLAALVGAMTALRGEAWFVASVRDIRAFRVEQWSDFTPFMHGPGAPGAP